MRSTNEVHKRTAFTLAGMAIVLRMASDWIFPQGGPLPYQLLQALLLLLALIFLRHSLDLIFLRGGQKQLAIRIGLLGIPLGLIVGLGTAWFEYGRPLWPSFIQMALLIANNLFFSAVEELEFRGFLLSWFSRRNMAPRIVILVVAVLATLAHAHRFLQFDIRSIAFTLAVNVWWTWIVYRTRSLWGAWVAHATWNIFVLLPVLGSGINIR